MEPMNSELKKEEKKMEMNSKLIHLQFCSNFLKEKTLQNN